MVPVLIAILVILCMLVAVRRFRLRERKHERLVLRRIAANYLEPHKRM